MSKDSITINPTNFYDKVNRIKACMEASGGVDAMVVALGVVKDEET